EDAPYRKAKIVATLGPATSSAEMVERLVTAGMNVARLNLSHGTIDDHRRMIATVKEVSKRLAAPVGILLDLQGPRIRTGTLPGKALKLEAGQKISIAPEGSAIEGPFITTNYTGLAGDVTPGARVLIDDGLVELRVIGVGGGTGGVVECEVVFGGTVGERKGMNLPGVDVSAPSLTEKDMEGIGLAVESGVDYVALSFVRKASDVTGLKGLLAERGAEIPVIAKIERAEAVENLTEILDASDGVMIARGDLGVELSAEKVPVLQKRIIEAAGGADKVVITATQMLDSMVASPRPTRAEASDVANAVFDGTDALMLSEETAVGRYPVEAVEMMVRIVMEAEGASPGRFELLRRREGLPDSFARAVACAAAAAAGEVRPRAIVAFTQTGDTALMLSKLRPRPPIVAFTNVAGTVGRLTLAWGVTPVGIDFGEHTDEMICRGEAALLDGGFAAWGDRVVIVSGTRVGMRGATNMMKIDWIGSEECRVHLKGDYGGPKGQA
ncbi:MAG: pyruvate kinase, partial [Thermodesulfobacteriota bacterium]